VVWPSGAEILILNVNRHAAAVILDDLQFTNGYQARPFPIIAAFPLESFEVVQGHRDFGCKERRFAFPWRNGSNNDRVDVLNHERGWAVKGNVAAHMYIHDPENFVNQVAEKQATLLSLVAPAN